MNVKRWLMASVAALVAIFIFEAVVHGVLLADIYRQTASVWRPEAEMKSTMWAMWLSFLIFAPLLALIYARGYEHGKSGVGQGFRFGAIVGTMLGATNALGWYGVLPIPGVLAAYWFAAIVVESILAGVLIGAIYRH